MAHPNTPRQHSQRAIWYIHAPGSTDAARRLRTTVARVKVWCAAHRGQPFLILTSTLSRRAAAGSAPRRSR